MKSEIFDGGGAFENLYWTGQDSSREAPRTTDQRMEITEDLDKKKKEEEKEKKEKSGFVLSQEGEY
jgi:hypothetical protein